MFWGNKGRKQKTKASVLFAQVIFGILGGFFTIAGIAGQMTFRPSIWYSGPFLVWVMGASVSSVGYGTAVLP